MEENSVRGIIVCNPVVIDGAYLDGVVAYAREHGINHIQVVGPIHDPLRGNIDGMTLFKRYAAFNRGKDEDFIRETEKALNRAAAAASAAGIRTYVWHHELDLPDGFAEAYPETLNEDGDFEISHPRIRDFLEWKLRDFFDAYPQVDGVILTLHETKVPLLKLKRQKLGRTERVRYVTEILYGTCRELGKELIVRPFASIPEDYDLLMQAYEQISPDLPVMDKWTQFDWSLCLPSNAFYRKIRNNPLLSETDVFGEYFGKGRLPVELREHIREKVRYCGDFRLLGYASRIDRNGMAPFGEVNEVNLEIMEAAAAGRDIDAAADRFYETRYPGCAREVAGLMRGTEDILRAVIYLKGYYFSELSYFPGLNHSKNHFYFEMMKDDYRIESGEWFIPAHWQRGSYESVLEEKDRAAEAADACLERLSALRGRMPEPQFLNLWEKFTNLSLVAGIWRTLVSVFHGYMTALTERTRGSRKALEDAVGRLLDQRRQGIEALGSRFYCLLGNNDRYQDFIGDFVRDIRESFALEERELDALASEPHLDAVVCGGGTESHGLRKEVNFSDTLVHNGRLCRIGGNRQGADWSRINAHGWFSYEMKVRPEGTTRFLIEAGTLSDRMALRVTVDGQEREFRFNGGYDRLICLPYDNVGGKDAVRIRIDKICADTPCVYRIMTK